MKASIEGLSACALEPDWPYHLTGYVTLSKLLNL